MRRANLDRRHCRCVAGDYTDLVVRQVVGTVYHYGGPSSPDVIPTGLGTVPPASLTTDASYATVPGSGLAAGVNNVYVRTRMPPGLITAAKARLYAGVAPATAMLWPDRLALLPTADGKPYAELDVPAGEIGVSPAPFVTDANVDPAATLGGYVFTAKHKTTLPTLGSVTALRDWLLATPAFAQRSTRPLDGSATSFEDLSSYEHRGTDPVLMMFELSWRDAYEKEPWKVSLASGDPERRIYLPPTPASGSGSVSVQLTLDRPFTSELRWTLTGTAPATEQTRFRLIVSLVDDDNVLIPLGGREVRRFPPLAPDPASPRRAATKAKESS